MRRAVLALAGLPAAAAAWTLLASAAALTWNGHWTHPYFAGHPRLAWAWIAYAQNPASWVGWGRFRMVATACAAALLIAAGVRAARAARRRRARAASEAKPVVRGDSDNHGHADWLPMEDARRLWPGPRGVVIGEAYRVDHDPGARGVRYKPRDPRTWGKGGTMPLLVDPCDDDGSGHSMRIAGPRGNKTASVVTMLAHPEAAWAESLFVLDPADQIGPLCRDAREAMGQRVVSIDLTRPSFGMNVLADIDPRRPRATRDVLSATAEICGEEPARHRDAIFDNAGRNMVACLLAHMIADPAVPPEARTLATFLEGITTPEDRMRDLLRGIHEAERRSDDHLGRTARRLAGIVLGLAEETFSGAYFNATQFVAWLFDQANADLLSAEGFRASDLARGGISVFCHVPLETLMHTPGVARVIVGSVVRAMLAANGRHAERVLMVTDERHRLGRVITMEVARDQGAKFGVVLHDLYQSNAQVKEVAGPGGPGAWFNALSWRAYSAVADKEDAEAISAMCGEYAVRAVSESESMGTSRKAFEFGTRSAGSNTNVHEIKRRLIKPDEIIKDMRRDEQIVILAGSGGFVRCGMCPYYRRPEMRGLVGEDRFVTRPREETEA